MRMELLSLDMKTIVGNQQDQYQRHLDIQNYFDFDTCVDYGCAKGFLVQALRILGCYGEDMSEYAIEDFILQ